MTKACNPRANGSCLLANQNARFAEAMLLLEVLISTQTIFLEMLLSIASAVPGNSTYA